MSTANEEEVKKIKQELEAERDWRLDELTKIRLLYRCIENSPDGLGSLSLYAKMTIPMIYAHWEGYCKSSFKYLIEAISKKELNSGQIRNSLLTFSLNKVYDKLKGKHSFNQKCDFTYLFINKLGNKIKFANKVDTKSNLNSVVFCDICDIFGLNRDIIEGYKSELDILVNIRNSIAHGKNSYVISKEQIEKYTNLVIELIDAVFVEQYSYIIEEKYLDNCPRPDLDEYLEIT